ncbi:VTT domain-containing protein [Patescibacteria group bacterium]|nr:VTT domain-containing protein [Patescibacteria group bacterium]
MRLASVFKTSRFHIPATWVAAALWCIAIFCLYYYYGTHGLSMKDMLYELFVFLSTDPRAPLLYIIAYTLQPFAFLPSTVFTVLAGSIFGFWPALVYTLIGANLSASTAYGVGRVLARPAPGLMNQLARWIGPLQRAPFETILFMRLAYFPFDVVNFVSGILKLRYLPFVIATAVGSVPGIATLTALGTAVSLKSLLAEGLSFSMIDIRLVGVSVVLFVVSIVIAEGVRRVQKRSLKAGQQ